ncbi:hypothetical protein LCK10_004360 [Salmonella enterica]|nr:hypothetical protein [Salmonella enterica]EDG0477490.1 hypothetical protein [Salmonella enterica subsp. enterica serovar Newport]EFT0777380.1 hypothetical protein [Salmonella enterica subsp. enterica serovar Amager]EAS5177548.1 hypothetical protein [Salmonella enterica]EAV1366468.1 hypothetical protein [Salmonella enterica]
MQEQQKSILSQMNHLQEKAGNRKKYSIAKVRMFQAEKKQLQEKYNQRQNNINALKGTLAELEKQKKLQDEKDALTKASELIADMGEKIGARLGEKYKTVAKEIANDIKNFQGKTLRTHKQTMTSLNKILANPGMKINKGDRDALINAWKSFKAGDTAKKLGNLSRAFKVADADDYVVFLCPGQKPL